MSKKWNQYKKFTNEVENFTYRYFSSGGKTGIILQPKELEALETFIINSYKKGSKHGNYTSIGWAIKRFEEGGTYDKQWEKKYLSKKDNTIKTDKFIKEIFGKEIYQDKLVTYRYKKRDIKIKNLKSWGTQGVLESILRNNSDDYEVSTDETRDLIKEYNKQRKLGKNKDELSDIGNEINERIKKHWEDLEKMIII